MNKGGKNLPKLNTNKQTDRTQVPRGKGEKNFDKRVNKNLKPHSSSEALCNDEVI